MLRVYTCIVQEHDLRLVVLAAVVCALASFTAINLVHHVRRSTGQMRQIWLGVAATASGFGIWATHFIAMLAFAPSIPSGYNVTLTLLSLIAAIVLTGIGLASPFRAPLPGARWLGGAIVGGGIAAMHYTGMAAFEIQGRIIWDPVLVIVSIAAGALIGSAATRVGLIEGDRKWKAFGALLLTVAICSHHFTAMGAASIMPDPRIVVSADRHPDRLAGRRGRARQPGDPAARLLRPGPRHSRPPSAGAGDRPHARPRQCRRRRSAGLRRREDRHRQP